MANNVTTRIAFVCNEQAMELVNQWFAKIDTDVHASVTSLFDVAREDITWEWMLENIGSKWCYLDMTWENSMRVVSAWDWPEHFVQWMADKIIAIDPDARLEVEYEDEMPNFIGYHIFTALGNTGSFLDSDQIAAMIRREVPALEELDEDSDEYYDMLWEHSNDICNHWQERGLDILVGR
jgi:hypothetical protein